MSTKRKIQPVSFSLTDPFEQKLYTHATQNGAFSKYIKRLIQRDMERAVNVKKAPVIRGGASALNGFVFGQNEATR